MRELSPSSLIRRQSGGGFDSVMDKLCQFSVVCMALIRPLWQFWGKEYMMEEVGKIHDFHVTSYGRLDLCCRNIWQGGAHRVGDIKLQKRGAWFCVDWYSKREVIQRLRRRSRNFKIERKYWLSQIGSLCRQAKPSDVRLTWKEHDAFTCWCFAGALEVGPSEPPFEF